MLPRPLRVLACVLAAALGTWCRAERDLESLLRPAHRVYTFRDGLPQNTVHAAVMEPGKGHLWIGTQDGLARFNGHRWQVIYLPNRQIANYVRTLAFDGSGALWVGTNGDGLFRYRDDRWERFGSENGLPVRRVNALLSDPSGRRLWIGTHGRGLWAFENGRFEADPIPGAPADGWIWALHEAPWRGGRRLWVGMEGAVAYKQDGHWGLLALPQELQGVSLNSLWAEPDGKALWVGSWGKGVWRWDGTWQRHGRAQGLPDEQLTSLVPTLGRGGTWTLWAGTFNGLARWNGKAWNPIGRRGDAMLRPIYSLLATQLSSGAEALWIGTRGGGLVRLDLGRWQSLDEASGLPSDEIRALISTPGPRGRPEIWVGAERGGLVSLRPEGLQQHPLPGGAQGIHSLLRTEEPGGPVIWVGTRVDGVLRWRKGNWDPDPARGLPKIDVLSLAQAELEPGRRRVYAGTIRGLYVFEGGEWQVLKVPEVSGAFIQCLHVFPEHPEVLWVGTRDGGLLRITASGAQRYGKDQGLPNPWIRDIAFRRTPSGGEVWIATAGGVAVLNERSGQIDLLERRIHGPLPSTVVNQVEFDATGRCYLMTTRGVVRLDPGEGGRWAMDHYTSEDGLPEGEGTPGASAQDAEGRLWVGTTAGLALLDLGAELRDQTPKRLMLEEVRAGDLNVSLEGARDFPHRFRDWTFTAALMGFTRGDRNQYRFQLMGYEDAPGPWSSEPRKTYTNLGSGTYRLRVWAQDGWGNPSGPVEWRFEIRPAPWATWWARSLQVLAVLGLTIAIFRWRMGLLTVHTRELAGAVAARTRELAEARDAAIAASRHKTDFLAVMSHEVRTPLNGILGMTELLQDTPLDPVQREYVEAIRTSNHHLSSLINDVLDLSKIEADRLDLEQVPFDLVQELEEVASPVATVARGKGLSLVCDLPGGLPTPVLGDPTRLRQVVLNLLNNAVKFTREGTVALRVTCVTLEPLRLQIEVEDSGMGIPEAMQARVFEPFRQGDASTNREFGGTGLGLAICRRLVERMGGTIRFTSQAGVGTRFLVELPLETEGRLPLPPPPGAPLLAYLSHPMGRSAFQRLMGEWGIQVKVFGRLDECLAALLDQEQGALRGILLDADGVGEDPAALALRCRKWGPVAFLAATEALPRLGEGLRAGSFEVLTNPWRQGALRRFLEGAAAPGEVAARTLRFQGRVLVVDDHPINRKVITAQLRKFGLESVEASGGQEALNRLGEEPFRLVFMDCEMPGMDGFEATRRLREHWSVPVVALTAHVLEGTRERCLAAGMNDYLSKPVHQAVLQQALERWLGPVES